MSDHTKRGAYMNKKQERRLARGRDAQRAAMRAYAPERLELFGVPDPDRAHPVHTPIQAWRSLSPKSGFNARRCS